jgi:hypothetical protein
MAKAVRGLVGIGGKVFLKINGWGGYTFLMLARVSYTLAQRLSFTV